MAHDLPDQCMGIFGGTFDPIHLGHLLLAERCREKLNLAQIRFVLADKAPHKQDTSSANAKHRWEMLRLAINSNPYYLADDRELRRGGTSYTVTTLAELHEEFPQCKLVFLMGADSLAEFHTWRQPEEICKLAHVVVVARGGVALPDLELLRPYMPGVTDEELATHLVAMPQMEISSTAIREQVAAGGSIRYQVPAAVEAYIEAHGLYAAR